MSPNILNSIGLILGLIGAVIVFYFGLPAISVLSEGSYVEIQITPKMKRYTRYSRFGLALIALSFLFQIAAVCPSITPLMENKVTVDWIGVGGLFLGFVGVAATIWAAIDARKQRTEREKAVIVAHSIIERTYGLLIGIKPFIVPLGIPHIAAVDDGLSAINQQRVLLDKL